MTCMYLSDITNGAKHKGYNIIAPKKVHSNVVRMYYIDPMDDIG